MTRTTLAVAADYADALLVARRSKNFLFAVLLLLLLLQVAVFLMYRFDALQVVSKANPAPAGDTTIVPATVTTPGVGTPAAQPARHGFEVTLLMYRWVLNTTGFLGVTLVIVLSVVLLLTSIIMLVGRLIGVSHVTSAFVWCVLLAVLLFPWQSLLNTRSEYDRAGTSAFPEADAGTAARPVPDQKLPGVLYTWAEVKHDGQWGTKNDPRPRPNVTEQVLFWMRFAGWPAVALLLLMTVQVKSSRGLRFALGESDIPVEVATVKPVVDTDL